MSKENKELIEAEILVYEPLSHDDFLRGFLAACRLFGVWKDGEQLLGSGETTVREMREAIEAYLGLEL